MGVLRLSVTVILLVFNKYLLGSIWDGEHPETTFCFIVSPLNISNAVLHTFRSDNMMCSSWTEAVNRVVWMGSAVHIHNPVPLKSAGNPGEVKYKALEIVLISLHMSVTCVYTVDDVKPAMCKEKFGYTTYSGMLYILLADRCRDKMATLSQSTLYNGSTALKWHMLIACCQ